MYWAVLTLGPILIGTAIAISAKNIFMALGIEEGIAPGWYAVWIFLLSWLVFTMMFVLVPNRRVQFRDAVVGAFLSAVLFELAKQGFVGYVSNANYSKIYGALATIPIFLFWLYIVWTTVLFGASLAASLTTFSERVNLGDWPDKWAFQLIFRLTGHLWRAQRAGQAMTTMQLLQLEEQASERQVLALLQQLTEARIVTLDHEDGWILARDLDDVSLRELYHCGNYYLPLAEENELSTDSGWDPVFIRSLATVHDNGEAILNRSLGGMYRESMKKAGKDNDLGDRT